MLLNCGCWRTLESALDSKEIQPVNPKGNKFWIFTGRTDDEAEAPIFWPLNVKNWVIEKDPDAGKDWRQEDKGTPEDEMVGWHHQHNGHEFEQALWVGDGQGSLVCCSPWGHKELDVNERLNWRVWKKAGKRIFTKWWKLPRPGIVQIHIMCFLIRSWEVYGIYLFDVFLPNSTTWGKLNKLKLWDFLWSNCLILWDYYFFFLN